MRYLFNRGWKFLETEVTTEYDAAMSRRDEFKNVEIPHDWLIYDSTDLYRTGRGWYIRELVIDEKKGRYFLEFDAVYMDSIVFVNGSRVCEWKYGYSAFDCDITDYVNEGSNLIAVSVTHISPNSRWYSGAGIYRNVHIRNTDETYIARDGVYVSTRNEDGKRIVHIETEVCGEKKDDAVINYVITDIDGKEVSVKKLSETDYEIAEPHLWDIDDPYLYTLKVSVSAGSDRDNETVRFGIRDTEFDTEKGFLLNGRKVKLNGVCEHHDLGSLGAAFNKCAMRRKFTMLRTMGVNALRTSHNMPAPEVLELCDEMGFVVMSEAFDMWYRPKTDYDYARFFTEWHERDIRSWVRQDRNHPSVIMWSIGNEIYDVHADANAPETVQHLIDEVKKHDPYENGRCTFASNYMPWEGGKKCADVLKLVGYNYAENLYKEHHEIHPDWIIYGSETESLVNSRGVYKFPLSVTKLSDVDEQCSSLGNCNTSWGAKSIEACICQDRDMDFSAGQFLWTGFDYIGEPTPYHTKNSYFGNIDTAGFPKDYYYVFKSAWTDPTKEPMIHIFPYWDFNPGQIIDVRVCSNEDTVELFLNGKSLGKQVLTHAPGSGDHILADYRVPYEEGCLEAVAYDKDGNITARDIACSFGESASIQVDVSSDSMRTGTDDLIFAEISVLDEDGNPVMNACNRMKVDVTGAGRLVGIDNGDSTDEDSYKAVSRRLFNGKLLAIIAPSDHSGEVSLKVSSEGLMDCEVKLQSLETETSEDSPFDKGTEIYLEKNEVRKTNLGADEEIPVRKLEVSADSRVLSPEKKDVTVKVKILPENATDKDIIFNAVSDKGVPVNFVKLTPGDGEVKIEALGDGEFRLRCMSKSGSRSVRVISELEFKVEGVGPAFLDPYGFIYGSAYTFSEGEIGAGNEMGFASDRMARSVVGFENVDFGPVGSDEITMPIFTLNGEAYPFKVYDGIPGKDGNVIGEFVYQKPSIWNTYQEDTWKFDKMIRGICSLYFEFSDKMHIKGFSFKKYEKAFVCLDASSADEIYGDDFKINGGMVEGIGNNVSIEFSGMDFGEEGTTKLTVRGNAPKDNTIHVRFTTGTDEIKNIIEFKKSDGIEEQTFEFEKVTGYKSVSFVFLPGSCFDFESFRFS